MVVSYMLIAKAVLKNFGFSHALILANGGLEVRWRFSSMLVKVAAARGLRRNSYWSLTEGTKF